MSNRKGKHLSSQENQNVDQGEREQRWNACLEHAAQEATKEFELAEKRLKEVEHALSCLRRDLVLQRETISGLTRSRELRSAYDDFLSKFDQLSSLANHELTTKFSKRKKLLKEVTVMLFGRTMAGKSTLMEALTHGSGKSIGIGLQNTTVTIQEYQWRNLRVVDTPGLEGLDKGAELAQLARDFVDEADYILFVVSDDAVMPADFEALGSVRDQNKPVIIVLNVKEKDINFLKDAPEEIFQSAEIDGHIRRIKGYAQQHLDLLNIQIVPLHAMAAYQSTVSADKKDSDLLRKVSRIEELENSFIELLRTTVISTRIKAPHESLAYYLENIAEYLSQEARNFKEVEKFVESARLNFENVYQDIWNEGIATLKRLKATTYELNEECWPLAEHSVDHDVDIRTKWQSRLKRLAEHSNELQSTITTRMQETLKQFAKDIQNEIHAMETSSMVGKFSISKPNVAEIKNMIVGKRVAGIGSAALGGGLTIVSVGLFLASNPVGWVVAGVAVVVGIVGSIFKSLFGDWQHKKRKSQVHQLGTQLRDSLWETYHRLNAHCYEWLKKNMSSLRTEGFELLSIQKTLLANSRNLTWKLVEQTRFLAAESNKHILQRLMELEVPAVRNGEVKVVAVARFPGRKCKVMVQRIQGDGDCKGAVLGKKGEYISRVSHAMSGEHIDLVEYADNPCLLVARSLGLQDQEANGVRIKDNKAIVQVPRHVDKRKLIGNQGTNIKMAQILTKMEIVFE